MVRRLNESNETFIVSKCNRLGIAAGSLVDDSNYYKRFFEISVPEMELRGDKETLDKIRKLENEFSDAVSTLIKLRDSLDDAFNDAFPTKWSKKKSNESVKRYRKLREADEDKLDGYAVAIKDTGKGYYHMLTFDSKSDAESAYKALVKIGKDMDAGKYENDIKGFNKELDKVLDTADEVTNRIDKTEMYNDYWEAFDETRYEIVGYVDLWINW